MTKKHHVRCWMRMLAHLTSATVCVQHHPLWWTLQKRLAAVLDMASAFACTDGIVSMGTGNEIR